MNADGPYGHSAKSQNLRFWVDFVVGAAEKISKAQILRIWIDFH